MTYDEWCDLKPGDLIESMDDSGYGPGVVFTITEAISSPSGRKYWACKSVGSDVKLGSFKSYEKTVPEPLTRLELIFGE